MALDQNNLRFLLWLRANGIVFGDIVTVGRLRVFVAPEIAAADMAALGLNTRNVDWTSLTAEQYCEPIMRTLGATSVESLDASRYEGAGILHNLNEPLPASLHKRCDLLFDGGSLEHVFNVPEALRSYVQLVRPGGWLVLDVPCDGCAGHGFYQLSPELFFRFFCDEIGCAVATIVCVRNEPGSPWRVLPDPAQLQSRVEPHDSEPLHLLVLVQRKREVAAETLAKFTPIQADYAQMWAQSASKSEAPTETTRARLRNASLNLVRRLMRGLSPQTYWLWSVRGNDRRRRRGSEFSRGAQLLTVDPKTWRLE